MGGQYHGKSVEDQDELGGGDSALGEDGDGPGRVAVAFIYCRRSGTAMGVVSAIILLFYIVQSSCGSSVCQELDQVFTQTGYSGRFWDLQAVPDRFQKASNLEYLPSVYRSSLAGHKPYSTNLILGT